RRSREGTTSSFPGGQNELQHPGEWSAASARPYHSPILHRQRTTSTNRPDATRSRGISLNNNICGAHHVDPIAYWHVDAVIALVLLCFPCLRFQAQTWETKKREKSRSAEGEKR